MSKITVMVVDDEKLTLEDFISMFDWDTNGFQIVATAGNGRQALKKYKETQPQIVISDIKMPLMDGIELIHEIRKINAQTKLILLTAYSEFSYAREAIKHGITDYILKNEINPDMITQKMLSIKKQIEAERLSRGVVAEKVILDFFRANNVIHFNNTDYDPEVIKLLSVSHFFMIVQQDTPLPIAGDSEYDDKQNDYEIILQCSSFSCQDFNVIYAGKMHDGLILLFIEPYEKYSTIAIYSAIMRGGETLQKELVEKNGGSFTLFALFNEMTLEAFKNLYEQKKRFLNVKYITGAGKIYNIQNYNYKLKDNLIDLDEVIVNKLLDNMDEVGISQYIENIYNQITVENPDSEGLLKVSKKLYSILKQKSETLLANTLKPSLNPLIEQSNWMNVGSIKQWMIAQFSILVKARFSEAANRYSPDVVKAIQFISNHYSDNGLKIDQIAAEVGLSANRLSVIFKKETSHTVNEYITTTRINKAKELLDAGGHKIYEIALLVGYSSSQYFSRIFYLATGLSPIDYKKRERK